MRIAEDLHGGFTGMDSKVTKQKWRRRLEVRSFGKCTSRTCVTRQVHCDEAGR